MHARARWTIAWVHAAAAKVQVRERLSTAGFAENCKKMGTKLEFTREKHTYCIEFHSKRPN